MRQLFLLSGNNCAFKDCRSALVNNNGTMIGDICHIEAAEKGGPRFNERMSNESRRSLANLVMLCKPHHSVIDGKAEALRWETPRLQKLKADHEAKFREVEETLLLAYDEQYIDATTGSDTTAPKTFASLDRFDPTPFGKPEYAKTRTDQVNSYIERLSITPLQHRRFAAKILRRWIRVGQKGGVVRVNVKDIQDVFNLTGRKVKGLVDRLEHYGLGNLEEDIIFGEVTYYVQLADPSDFVTWTDLVAFAEDQGTDVEVFLIEGCFDQLD